MPHYSKLYFIFFVSWMLIVLPMLSQEHGIKGRIVRKENKEPIDGVIIKYGHLINNVTYSDILGNFIIPEKKQDTIYIQNMGYMSISLAYTDLLKNSLVEMDISAYELPAVEISYIDADILLKKAIYNTQKRLLTEHSIINMLHLIQSEGDQKNELFMKYSSTLDKDKVKDRNIPYKLSLKDIYHAKSTLDEGLSNQIPCEYHPTRILSVNQLKNHKATLSLSSDNSLIALKLIPLSEEKNSHMGVFYINKEDTTIHSINLSLVGGVGLKDRKYSKFGNIQSLVKDKSGYIEFSNYEGMYYMSKSIVSFTLLNKYKNGSEAEMTYFFDVKAVDIEDYVEGGEKLTGFSKQLFNIPNTITAPPK